MFVLSKFAENINGFIVESRISAKKTIKGLDVPARQIAVILIKNARRYLTVV